jgi:3-dehydroquinate dehydratase-1
MFDSFVLAAATPDLDDEPAAREHADAVEFRMDMAPEPRERLAAYDGTLPVIATNRADWEGGEAADDSARIDALAAAARNDHVGAIDVELQSVDTGDAAPALEAARRHDTAVIVSKHDFEGTPARATLDDWLARATAAGDVGKIAVTASGPDDVLALLGATRARTAAGERVATMAMGEAGRHSRAVTPLYGSRIAYAPVTPANATAPGQYDLATLRGLIDRLGDPAI